MQIEFRAWNAGNNEWLSGDDIIIYPNGFISVFYNKPLPVNIFHEYYPLITVQQFICRLDKNGNKIFVGDLIKKSGETKIQVFNFGKRIYSPYWEISEVVFHKGAFMQVIRAQHNSWFGEIPSKPYALSCLEEYYEVVGNVFDNPELIVTNESK
jgi:uncharacterized phage protein (TIGR01671 family)